MQRGVTEMGYYINPFDMTKERFLQIYGTTLNPEHEFDFSASTLPVCLVDNGPFTAAAIAYNKNEMDAFKQPDDYRPKKWYEVSRKALEPYYKDAF